MKTLKEKLEYEWEHGGCRLPLHNVNWLNKPTTRGEQTIFTGLRYDKGRQKFQVPNQHTLMCKIVPRYKKLTSGNAK